jgi:hypothetical protein
MQRFQASEAQALHRTQQWYPPHHAYILSLNAHAASRRDPHAAQPPHAQPPGATRFKVTDVLRDMSLQRAARRELEGSGPDAGALSTASDPDALLPGALDGAGHEGEVDRQRAAVRELDGQVAAESRVNRGMAALLLERLDSSRRWAGFVKLGLIEGGRAMYVGGYEGRSAASEGRRCVGEFRGFGRPASEGRSCTGGCEGGGAASEGRSRRDSSGQRGPEGSKACW